MVESELVPTMLVMAGSMMMMFMKASIRTKYSTEAATAFVLLQSGSIHLGLVVVKQNSNTTQQHSTAQSVAFPFGALGRAPDVGHAIAIAAS